MAQNFTVKVTLAEIMDNLKLISSYFGGKREEDSAGYDKVAVLDCDSSLVALLMEDAAMRISAFIPGQLIRWRYYQSALEFTFEEEKDPEGAHSVLSKAVAQEVLRRWLRISGSEYADTLSAPGAELTDALSIYFPEKVRNENSHVMKASSRQIPPI